MKVHVLRFVPIGLALACLAGTALADGMTQAPTGAGRHRYAGPPVAAPTVLTGGAGQQVKPKAAFQGPLVHLRTGRPQAATKVVFEGTPIRPKAGYQGPVVPRRTAPTPIVGVGTQVKPKAGFHGPLVPRRTVRPPLVGVGTQVKTKAAFHGPFVPRRTPARGQPAALNAVADRCFKIVTQFEKLPGKNLQGAWQPLRGAPGG